MHSIEIPEARLMLYMPNDLSECNAQQYMDMCELIYRYQCGQLPFDDLRTQAAYKLLNLTPGRKPLLIVDEEAKWSNLWQVSHLIDNFFDDVEGSKVIRQDYTDNPIPTITPLWKTYYGPSDGFMNVTFGEYTDALRLFLDYSTTGNVSLLYLLAAVFYRRKKSFHWLKKGLSNYDGDIREAYNPNIIEKRARLMESAPIGFVYGFYLLFASFQKYLTTAVIQWGANELDFSILFDGGDNDDKMEAVPGIGMDQLAFAVAESGQFGDIKAVRRTNLWDVLVLMYSLRKKDLDYKLNEKTT
jgi:hypothetical protein